MVYSESVLLEAQVKVWQNLNKIEPKNKGFKLPKLIISNRLRKTAAYNTCQENSVTLAGRFLITDFREMLEVILPHEFIHQVDYNVNGWNKGQLHHGPYWCNLMCEYGLFPEPYHSFKVD